MNIPERVRKIEEMEKILDEHDHVIKKLRTALEEFKLSQTKYGKLKDYYINGEYLRDVDSYNNGELPENLKCGVLSEDAVFDLMGDNFYTAVEMLEIATAVIKDH